MEGIIEDAEGYFNHCNIGLAYMAPINFAMCRERRNDVTGIIPLTAGPHHVAQHASGQKYSQTTKYERLHGTERL